MSESIRVSGKNRVLPKADGRRWKFSQRPGGWVIAESDQGDRSRIAFYRSENRFAASLGGKLWSGEWNRSTLSEGSGASAYSDASSDSDLTAQFPGKVRKILVQSGNLVAEGDPLILVEAMKMEFAVKAPFSGTVRKVLVQEQQQLMPGDRLIDMETESQ